MNRKEKLKKGEKVAGLAIWLEGFLVAAKVGAGLLSGSIVLISDAIHSAADILSIVTSWFGLKISQREADERFSYGYYKAENLGSLLISFLIIYASFEMFINGYERLFLLSTIKMAFLAALVSLVDAIFLFFFGNYEIKVGKEAGAQSLVAMGKENRTHIFSSSVVLIGILAGYFKVPYVEGLITIAISFLIFKIGFETLKDALFSLMDVSPSLEMKKKIAMAVESIPGIEEVLDLKLRKSGPFVFGEVKVGIRKFVDVKKAHEITEKVESEVKKRVSKIDSFSVYIKPYKSDFRHLVIPVKNKKGMNSAISSRFGRASYFLFVNLKGKEIRGYYFLKNPYREKKVRAGLGAAKLVSKQKSDMLITKEIGEISFHTLRDNLVDVYKLEGEKVKQVIDKLRENKLKKMSCPTCERE